MGSDAPMPHPTADSREKIYIRTDPPKTVAFCNTFPQYRTQIGDDFTGRSKLDADFTNQAWSTVCADTRLAVRKKV